MRAYVFAAQLTDPFIPLPPKARETMTATEIRNPFEIANRVAFWAASSTVLMAIVYGIWQFLRA